MVQCRSAVLVIENPTCVQLERSFVGFNCHADRLVCRRFLECAFVVGRHVFVSIDGHHGSRVSTHSLAHGVGIVCFGGDAPVLDDEFERIVHQSSVAPMVPGGVAIDELLFAERDQFSGVDGIDAFYGSRGGEGPAASTHPLIFDVRDGSFFPPIHLFGQFLEIHVVVSERRVLVAQQSLARFGVESQVLGFELVHGEVRQSVQSEPMAGVLCVVFLHVSCVAGEHPQPFFPLFDGFVGFSESHRPFVERLTQVHVHLDTIARVSTSSSSRLSALASSVSPCFAPVPWALRSVLSVRVPPTRPLPRRARSRSACRVSCRGRQWFVCEMAMDVVHVDTSSSTPRPTSVHTDGVGGGWE